MTFGVNNTRTSQSNTRSTLSSSALSSASMANLNNLLPPTSNIALLLSLIQQLISDLGKFNSQDQADKPSMPLDTSLELPTSTTTVKTTDLGKIPTGTTPTTTTGTKAATTGTVGTGTVGTGTASTAGTGTVGTGTVGIGTASTAGAGTVGTGTVGTGTVGTGTVGTGTVGTGTVGTGATATGATSPIYYNQGDYKGVFAQYADKQTHAAADLQKTIAAFSQTAALGKGTGTGLDSIITNILNDKGLRNAISDSQIRGGAYAANALNALFAQVAHETGADTDGKFTTQEVEQIGAIVRNNYGDAFKALHGNDNNGHGWTGDATQGSTGFHLVQNDGGTTQLNLDGTKREAINTIYDGFYHYGFDVQNGKFLNEDGNANQSVEDVTKWLNSIYFQAPNQANGEAAPSAAYANKGDFDGVFSTYNGKQTNSAHDLQSVVASISTNAALGKGTGNGLDQVVNTILHDNGLNATASQNDIRGGAYAANGLNALFTKIAQETGADTDGKFTETEIQLINSIIRNNYSKEFTALHGSDANTSGWGGQTNSTDTGFHLVQNDGATSTLNLDGQARAAVNTVFDGMYHFGFEVKNGSFVNENGAANATVKDVTNWFNKLYFNAVTATNVGK